MTNTEFRVFEKQIKSAGETDDIWWAGHIWLALTGRQCRSIGSILEQKSFISRTMDLRGREAYRLPSGLTMAIE